MPTFFPLWLLPIYGCHSMFYFLSHQPLPDFLLLVLLYFFKLQTLACSRFCFSLSRFILLVAPSCCVALNTIYMLTTLNVYHLSKLLHWAPDLYIQQPTQHSLLVEQYMPQGQYVQNQTPDFYPHLKWNTVPPKVFSVFINSHFIPPIASPENLEFCCDPSSSLITNI